MDKITPLTDLWYSIVSIDHHKDRDCHWYINKVWSYGKLPIYRVEHYGYIYHEEINQEFDDYEEAEEYLYKTIKEAINTEIEWSKKVLDNVEEWGSDQAERAGKILKLVRETNYDSNNNSSE